MPLGRAIRRVIASTPGSRRILDSIAEDGARPHTAYELIDRLSIPKHARVLDLGCGAGASHSLFSDRPDIHWSGVDVSASPERASARTAQGSICVFDGTRLPFADGSFDLILSRSVLEHVRHPDLLLREVSRVLKQHGVLVGDVAFLYPYHSLSLFNYTPLGLITVLEDAGISKVRLSPTWDVFSCIARLATGRSRLGEFLLRTSPTLAVTRFVAKLLGLAPRESTYLQLQLCGVFSFRGTKGAAIPRAQRPGP